MRCSSCNFENREGVRFCENCGNPFPAQIQYAAPVGGMACPNCRQINPIDTFFCMYCGTALHAQPTPAPPPRRRRRGCLIWASLLLVLIFLCSLSYWTTLIRIPILPRTASAPPIVIEAARVANVIQHNLNPPEGIVDFMDIVVHGKNEPVLENLVVQKAGRNPNPREMAGGPNGGVVEVPPPGFTAPPVCGPELELTVSNVREIQPWGGGFAGLWGNGPTLYEIQNNGEPLRNNEYGYKAVWWVHQNGGQYLIAGDELHNCSIISDTLLTCSGPNRDIYETAELTIFSENPDCPMPLGSFIFKSDSAMPVEEEKTEACSPLGSFSLAGFVPWLDGVSRDTILWEFDIHFENYTLEQIDYQYYLIAEGFDSPTGEWKTSQNSCYVNIYGKLACWGWNKEKFSSIRYALYQLPDDICTDPVDFGSMGSVTVAGETEQPVCEFNQPVQLEMVGRSSQNLTSEGEGYNFYATSNSDVFDPEDTFYALYDIRDSSGNLVQQGQRGDCSLNWAVDVQRVGGWYGFSCQGPTASNNQQVSMQLFYSKGGCNHLVAKRTWPATVVAMSTVTAPPYDRCKTFSSINIKPIVMNWILGSPVNLYFEMPGGVPGLEKKIPGDNDPWIYTVQIGDKSSTDCEFIPDYEERLYCSISLPDYYSNSVNPLNLSVNGCNQTLSTLTTYLILDKSGGGTGCPAGQTYHPPNSVWPGGCCSNGHWYIWGNDKEPGCWN